MLQNQHYLTIVDQPNVPLSGKWTLSQALSLQRQQNPTSRGALNTELDSAQPLTTLLEEFGALGGLAVLSKHLPMLLCASTSTTSSVAFESVTLSVKGANASGIQMLLRLALGVSDDGQGGRSASNKFCIYSSL